MSKVCAALVALLAFAFVPATASAVPPGGYWIGTLTDVTTKTTKEVGPFAFVEEYESGGITFIRWRRPVPFTAGPWTTVSVGPYCTATSTREILGEWMELTVRQGSPVTHSLGYATDERLQRVRTDNDPQDGQSCAPDTDERFTHRSVDAGGAAGLADRIPWVRHADHRRRDGESRHDHHAHL